MKILRKFLENFLKILESNIKKSSKFYYFLIVLLKHIIHLE